MNYPTFSVIIPVHNRARELLTAIKSVLAQSLQDFEIIVIDDGSTDHPEQIIERMEEPRIRILRQVHLGASAARNAGIDMARGHFVAFLDSDDRFLPHHLKTMKNILANKKSTVGYARIIVDRGRGRMFSKPARAKRPAEHMATYLMCDRGFVQTSTLVMAASMARKVRYDEKSPYIQDLDFAIRLYSAGCEFVMVEEPSAVWYDAYDVKRISALRRDARLTAWLEKIQPHIPERAYLGYKGWIIARAIASTDRIQGLKLYVQALVRGCYRPRLAIAVFFQIVLSEPLFRVFADRAGRWLSRQMLNS